MAATIACITLSSGTCSLYCEEICKQIQKENNIITICDDRHSNTISKTQQEILDKLQQFAIEGVQKLGLPSIAYAIVMDGRIVSIVCINNTSIIAKPITKNTHIPIASTSKHLTGTLCLVLKDKGLLDFSDKFAKFYPNTLISSNLLTQKLTIQDIICMGSGLDGFSCDFFLWSEHTKKQIIKSLAYAHEKSGYIGKYFSYQNSIFGMIDKVIEDVTHTKYHTSMQKYVFAPLEMHNTFIGDVKSITTYIGNIRYHIRHFNINKKNLGLCKSIARIIGSLFGLYKPDIATLYQYDKHGRAMPIGYSPNFQTFPATSGVTTTISDFAKYLQYLVNGKTVTGKQLISDNARALQISDINAINEIHSAHFAFTPIRIKKASYGVGSINLQYTDNKIHGHYGGVDGVTSSMFFDPFKKIGICVLCNIGGINESSFMQSVSYQFFDLAYQLSETKWIDINVKNKRELIQYKNVHYAKYIMEHQPIYSDIIGKYTYKGISMIEIYRRNNDIMCSDKIHKPFKLKYISQLRDGKFAFEFNINNITPYTFSHNAIVIIGDKELYIDGMYKDFVFTKE